MRNAVALAAILAAYLWLALAYAVATPLWQNPDEPAHFNYVAQVARTGTLPVLEPGDWDAALLERLKTGRLQPEDSVARIRYESWQPPLYYLLAAQVDRLAAPAPGGRADRAAEVRALRLFDVLLGGLTVAVGYAAARELFHGAPGGDWLALAVPTAMVGVPMFAAVSAAITNDALANLLAACLVLALLRLHARREGRRRGALALGVLLGLGLLTKLSLAVFLPLALAVLAARGAGPGRRWAPLAGDALLMLGLALALVGPWLIRQGLVYGWDDLLATRRHAAVAGDQPRFPGLSAGYLWSRAATTFHSFWAQFGWMAIPAPDRLYWAWGLLTLAGALGLALWAARAGLRDPGPPLLGAVFLATLASLAAYNLTFEQAQGRYLFPALVPICGLLVVGWGALAPARLRPLGALAPAAGLVALNAYALARVLQPGFGR